MSQMHDDDLISPELAQRIAQLGVHARRVVEGALTGAHRSPHRGASMIFVEHRDYRPGDDVRRIDWRAHARTDRDVIKHFEQETQLDAALILDASGSMAYPDPGAADSKSRHAAVLLAALGLILLRQGDAVGALRVDQALRERLPARRQRGHLQALLRVLARPPEPEAPTRLAPVLLRALDTMRRRGLVVLASDLLDPDPAALAPLAQMVAKGHQVFVLHTLHRDEVAFGFTRPCRFQGLEGEGAVEADPELLRSAYAQELDAFLRQAQHACTRAGAHYTLALTDEPPAQVLTRVLGSARPSLLRSTAG